MRETKDMTPAQLMRCGKERLVREITRLRLELAIQGKLSAESGTRSGIGLELEEASKPVTRAELEAVLASVRQEVASDAAKAHGELVARVAELEAVAKMASSAAEEARMVSQSLHWLQQWVGAPDLKTGMTFMPLRSRVDALENAPTGSLFDRVFGAMK